MTQDQFNLVGMFTTVDDYLEKHTATWSGLPALVTAKGELAAAVELIRTKTDRQETPTTGPTGLKNDARDDLEDELFEVADLVAAWAAAEGKPEVSAAVETTRSALDNLSGDDLEVIARRVLAAAQENLAALGDYDLTATDLTGLDAKIKAFSGVKNAPRLAIAGRAGETATLPDLIQATRLLLRNRVDKLITRFRRTAPEFVAGYRAARVIVDRPATNPPEAPERPTPPPA